VNLIELLDAIVLLLRECGQFERSAWFGQCIVTLEDPASTRDALEHTKTEIHGVILGMGGLMCGDPN
jgi:hypothetical protein